MVISKPIPHSVGILIVVVKLDGHQGNYPFFYGYICTLGKLYVYIYVHLGKLKACECACPRRMRTCLILLEVMRYYISFCCCVLS